MRKKKSRAGYACIILAICVFAAISCFTAKNTLTLVSNLTVLAIMLVFILAGMGKVFAKKGLTKLDKVSDDLRKLAGRLDASFDKGEVVDPIEELRSCKDGCASPHLSEAIEEMLRESDALYIGNQQHFSCAVEDYINEDLLRDVSNADFNDFVSTAMTGLGILGTFVGLAFGLQSFNTETAEAMTNSIAPLIEGIKVAFYTSIFGVTLSLIYSTVIRNRHDEASDCLNGFISSFYRHVGARPADDAVSRILKYEKAQTESMDQFAENISVALADVLTPVLGALPEQISQSINGTVSPMLLGVANALDGLSTNLVNKLSDAQSEGVGQLVNDFIEQMNKALDGQFENLASSIQSICSWQEGTLSKLDEVLKTIVDNSNDIADTRDALAATIKVLKEFADSMALTQQSAFEHFDKTAATLESTASSIEALGNELAEISERNGEIMKSASDIIEAIRDSENDIADLIDTQTEKLSEGSKILSEEAGAISEVCRDMTKGFNDATEQMMAASARLSSDMDTAMERTYAQFDSQLAKAIQHFSGTLSELQEITESIPKVLTAASKQNSADATKYIDLFGNSQKEYAQKIETAIKEMISEMSGMRRTVAQLEKQLVSDKR